MSSSQKGEEGKLAEVAAGTLWMKTPCVLEWQFHAPASAKKASRRHQMYSRATVLLWRHPKAQKVFLSVCQAIAATQI